MTPPCIDGPSEQEQELPVEMIHAVIDGGWFRKVSDARKAFSQAGVPALLARLKDLDFKNCALGNTVQYLTRRTTEAEQQRDSAGQILAGVIPRPASAPDKDRNVVELAEQAVAELAKTAILRSALVSLFMGSGEFQGTDDGAIVLAKDRIQFLLKRAEAAEQQRDRLEAEARALKDQRDSWHRQFVETLTQRDAAQSTLLLRDRSLADAHAEIRALRAEVAALRAWSCATCGARFSQQIPAALLDGVARCSSCADAESLRSELAQARAELQTTRLHLGDVHHCQCAAMSQTPHFAPVSEVADLQFQLSEALALLERWMLPHHRGEFEQLRAESDALTQERDRT